jgi:hypothetical protein
MQLAEAKTGSTALVIPLQVLTSVNGLVELLVRLPHPLASSVIVWGREGEALPDRLKENASLRIFRGSELDLAVFLAGLEELQRIGILGDEQAYPALKAYLDRFQIPTHFSPPSLKALFLALGVPGPTLAQADLEELEQDLLRLQST